MRQYAITPSARKQIDRIWLYIAQDKPLAADRWLTDLEATFAQLGQAPGMGRHRSDLLLGNKQVWPFGEYLVIYRKAKPGVQILSVIHGARDWPRSVRPNLS